MNTKNKDKKKLKERRTREKIKKITYVRYRV